MKHATLRYVRIDGTLSPAETVTIDSPCSGHVDCIKVIFADGYPGWFASSELEEIPE